MQKLSAVPGLWPAIVLRIVFGRAKQPSQAVDDLVFIWVLTAQG